MFDVSIEWRCHLSLPTPLFPFLSVVPLIPLRLFASTGYPCPLDARCVSVVVQFIRTLGRGSYGEVAQCEDLKEGGLVAIKRVLNVFNSEVRKFAYVCMRVCVHGQRRVVRCLECSRMARAR